MKLKNYAKIFQRNCTHQQTDDLTEVNKGLLTKIIIFGLTCCYRNLLDNERRMFLILHHDYKMHGSINMVISFNSVVDPGEQPQEQLHNFFSISWFFPGLVSNEPQ